jgi:hypothetical protein
MAVISTLIGLAGVVLTVVIGWRIMKAFESIATSASKIAEKQK